MWCRWQGERDQVDSGGLLARSERKRAQLQGFSFESLIIMIKKINWSSRPGFWKGKIERHREMAANFREEYSSSSGSWKPLSAQTVWLKFDPLQAETSNDLPLKVSSSSVCMQLKMMAISPTCVQKLWDNLPKQTSHNYVNKCLFYNYYDAFLNYVIFLCLTLSLLLVLWK